MPANLRLAPIPHLSLFPKTGAPFAAFLAFFLLSCNLFDRDLGDSPIGSENTSLSGSLDSLAGGWDAAAESDYMRIFVTPQTLKAGHRDRAQVTARVFDANHNPIEGQIVRFASRYGGITARDTTDEQGEAKAEFTSIPENTDIPLLAGTLLDGKWHFVGTKVSLRGATVNIEASSIDTLLGKPITLKIKVADADGEGVSGADLKLEGMPQTTAVTDAEGIYQTTVISQTAGTLRVKASAIGASDSLAVGFFSGTTGGKTNNLSLYVDPGRVLAAEGATAKVKAILYDDRHNPVPNKTIAFAASHGRIGALGVTDEQGIATVTFSSTPQNVDATVSASATLGDSLKTATAPVTLVGLTVDIQPTVQDALSGDSIAVAIRVKDGLGKPLANAPLILGGMTPASGATNAGGVFNAKVSSKKVESIRLTASSLGAGDSASVFFWTTLPADKPVNNGAIGNLRIFVQPSHIKASNSDIAQVKVIAFDNLNNPIAGRPVLFTTTAGIISSSDTTDGQGEARATLRAVPVNADARVTATMLVDDSSLTVATTVTFEGLKIEVLPSTQNALVTKDVNITIRLTDGAGSPVPDATILFDGNPGVGTTDGAGELFTTTTNGVQGRKVIRASALGAKDSSYVDFWTVLPGKEQVVDTVRSLRVFSSRSQLRADNTDFALITVILAKDGNNPASGEAIRFTSNLGLIDGRAVVDSAGRAQVTLRSAPVNGICRITAVAEGRNLSASTEVIFSGVTLQLSPERTDFKIGEDAILDAFLKDGSGNPIGGDAVTFTASGANGLFNNDQKTYTVTLNPVGRAQVRVRSTTSGTVKVLAQSLNTADSVNLRFSNNSLSLAANQSSIGIASSDSVRITATYVDGNNQPVSGAAIKFAANAGSISPASVNTNGSGVAIAYLKPAAFSGTAVVQATAPGGTAQTEVAFNAAAAAKIKLEISPDNIAVNGGVASLRAVVTDAQGNRVTGQDVSFRILQGPGGGENILKPVAQTQAGVALSQLESGSIPSAYRGVSVEARIGNLADTSKLTVSGPAYTITIARPEDDSVKVANGGVLDDVVFRMNMGAVVQDVNGNPVADGTEVHFSAVITGLAVGTLYPDGFDNVGGKLKAINRLGVLLVPFEDINNNNRMDAGIDLTLDANNAVAARGEDANGDGVYDWNPALHDFWVDFNHNGVCDAGVSEDAKPLRVAADSILKDTVLLWHDLYPDGVLNTSEVIVDRGGAGCGDQPASGDFPYHRWETRQFLDPLEFTRNDFAVVIPTSAITVGGVANAPLVYPRQLANRLEVLVNGEVNGIRDRDGERFVLKQIKN